MRNFALCEKLIEATAEWVSDKMFCAVFGAAPGALGERDVGEVDVADLTDRLHIFAMDNPELCRIRLLQLLSSPEPSRDPFWREYEGSLARFAATDLAQPGIDTEALSVLNLAGAFLWPVLARSHAHGDDERRALALRFSTEALRLSMYGSVQSSCYPEVAERLGKAPAKPTKLRVVG